MVDLVIDTDILIDHLRGLILAKEYLKQKRDAKDKLMISVVTEAEIFAGKKMEESSEAKKTELLLELFEIIGVDSQIAREAGKLRRSFDCKLPDAIIAATAILHRAKLVTRNKGHFEMIPDIDIIVPY